MFNVHSYKKPEPEEGELGLRLPFSNGYKAIATSESSEGIPDHGMTGRYRARNDDHFIAEDF